MAIIDTITPSQAADKLRKVYDGSSFTYSGALALCEYLDELSEDRPIEFDPIAWCCEFSEHASLWDWVMDYGGERWAEDLGFDLDREASEEDKDNAISEYIQDHGTLIEFDGGIIVSAF